MLHTLFFVFLQLNELLKMPTYSYLQLLFFISELGLLLLKRAKRSTVKTGGDNRSLLMLWIVIGGCLSIGPYSATYHIWAVSNAQTLVFVGCGICIIGFIIRWIAIAQLGKMFTVNVVIDQQHTLKTSGLYKIVRHPSYLGIMLIIAGLQVCTGSVFTFIIVVVPVFIALNYRIIIEEKALIGEFGSQYEDYKNRVSRLIPGIY
jgi:protein-S-isoprenylcysteine O-methyltransferase Ste14